MTLFYIEIYFGFDTFNILNNINIINIPLYEFGICIARAFDGRVKRGDIYNNRINISRKVRNMFLKSVIQQRNRNVWANNLSFGNTF